MSRHYVMCRPTYFAVNYAINPWMDPTLPVDVERAHAQWEALYQTYLSLGHEVDLVEPVPGLPDMVFAANGATVVGRLVLGSQFRHPERAEEAPEYLSWFSRAGYDTQVAKYVNEGEGDLLLVDGRGAGPREGAEWLLAGTGFRTEPQAHAEAQELFGRPTISLQLVDPRYYHLDTALFVLSPGNIAYLPEAFSLGSQQVLRRLYPDAVLATKADAAVLGLNAVSDGYHVVLSGEATGLIAELTRRGYEPVPVDLSELRKAGGGAKCCTLELHP